MLSDVVSSILYVPSISADSLVNTFFVDASSVSGVSWVVLSVAITSLVTSSISVAPFASVASLAGSLVFRRVSLVFLVDSIVWSS